MTFVRSTILELARAISDAHDQHGTIPPPPGALTIAQGYAVQVDAVRRRGTGVAGYKIGLTNAGAQRAFGTTEPIIGRLRADDLLRSSVAAPAIVPSSTQPRFAEAELVVEIGRDLPGEAAPYDRATVAAAIGGVYAGIELCRSRYAVDDVDLGALVADNGHAEWLVIGDRLSTRWEDRFAALDAQLLRTHGAMVTGNTTAVLGDPLNAVTWLANWLATHGEMLRQGQVIATGSCTGITEIARNERITSSFADGSQAHARVGDPAS